MNKDCFEIITNYYCNLKCSFCSQLMNGYNPDKKIILNEIFRAKKEGFRRIGFSGGESTLREDLSVFITMAQKVGFKFIRLQTNGYKLSDIKYADKLINSGLTYCKFTFLSHKKEIHDKLTSKKGAFDISFKGIKNLSGRIGIGVNILINRYNFEDIYKTVKFFMDNGVSDFVIIYPVYISSMFDNRNEIGISIKKVKNKIIDLLDRCYEHGILSGIKVLNIPPCSLGKYAERSSEYYRFNTVVSEPGLRRFDIDTQIKKNKIKRDKCRECIYFMRCSGVDKNYIDIFGWDSFKPVLKKMNLAEPEIYSDKIYLTSQERCIFEVLKAKGKMKTEDLIKNADIHPLCRGCKDGLSIINTLNSLLKKGAVKKEFINGIYLWELI